MGHVCVSFGSYSFSGSGAIEFTRFLWPSVADLDLGPVKFSMSSMSRRSTNDCDQLRYDISIHSEDRKVDKKLISR